MKIKRYISIYDKNSDKFINERKINISVEDIKKILDPYENDPLFLMVYKITPDKICFLKNYISINFDFDQFEYFLESYDGNSGK